MTELDPVEITLRLMEVDSTSGSEGAVITVAERMLLEAGWSTDRILVSTGREDLYAKWGDAPQVTFSTHLDTVPPFIPPKLDGNTIRGRGSCDAKGIAAAMICAAEKLRTRGISAGLLFVVGEEVSHDGAHAANSYPNQSKVLINGEPTESTLALGTKGAVRFTLRTHGVPAHSAYPELGKSATSALARLLVELEGLKFRSDPVLGETTINVGVISGGIADNVVAPSAEARLMARLVGPKEELLGQLTKWLNGRADLEASIAVPPIRLGTFDGYKTSVASFATDIPALTNWGTPYLFGPGSIHVAHSDNEFIDIVELRNAVEAYERLAVLALEREMK